MSWKCSRCGKCCRFLAFPLKEQPTEEDVRWLTAHPHIFIVGNALIVKTKCRHLKYKNGKHYCDIYDKRPKICRDAGKKECEISKQIWKELGVMSYELGGDNNAC